MINTKLVTIESPGKIGVLGGLIGPITTPCKLDVDVIIALINSGKAVYEVNPANLKEKTRLTRLNVRKEIYSNNIKRKVTQSDSIVNKSKTDNNVKTKSSNHIKANDVGLTKVTNEPSTVKTTINQETDEGMLGTDIFVSNKKS